MSGLFAAFCFNSMIKVELAGLNLILNSEQNSLATHFVGFIILLKRKSSLQMLPSSDNQHF